MFLYPHGTKHVTRTPRREPAASEPLRDAPGPASRGGLTSPEAGVDEDDRGALDWDDPRLGGYRAAAPRRGPAATRRSMTMEKRYQVTLEYCVP